ncbi:MAG TPA: hypothetical protein VF455_13035 [Chryseobacterium sp.]
MSRNLITTIFQNTQLSCRVKILFVLFFMQGFYSIYGQMSLQGSVVVIDEDIHDKRIDYLSIASGTYIYSNTESKHQAKSKTIINIAVKSSQHKHFKEKNLAIKKYPKPDSIKYYTHRSEVFFNTSVSTSFACTGNNYQVKKDAVLIKNELFEVFYFSKDTKSPSSYNLKTQYNHSNPNRIRPPPSFI